MQRGGAAVDGHRTGQTQLPRQRRLKGLHLAPFAQPARLQKLDRAGAMAAAEMWV